VRLRRFLVRSKPLPRDSRDGACWCTRGMSCRSGQLHLSLAPNAGGPTRRQLPLDQHQIAEARCNAIGGAPPCLSRVCRRGALPLDGTRLGRHDLFSKEGREQLPRRAHFRATGASNMGGAQHVGELGRAVGESIDEDPVLMMHLKARQRGDTGQTSVAPERRKPDQRIWLSCRCQANVFTWSITWTGPLKAYSQRPWQLS